MNKLIERILEICEVWKHPKSKLDSIGLIAAIRTEIDRFKKQEQGDGLRKAAKQMLDEVVSNFERTPSMQEWDFIHKLEDSIDKIIQPRPTKSTEDSGLRDALIEYLNPHHPRISYLEYTELEREYFKGVETVKEAIGHILRQHPKNHQSNSEPLAKMAQKYGCYLGPQWETFDIRKDPKPSYWTIEVIKENGTWTECVTAPTYSECEAKARQHLESLPEALK